MMVQLNAPRQTNEDVVALLLECHDRIRRFSSMAVQLASASASEPELIQDAAQRVHRYFSVAMPLHVEDEDKSIQPRLEKDAPEMIIALLQKMNREHERIDAILVELLPVWDELRRDPSHLGEHRNWLQAATRSFESLMMQHLEMEEIALFPLMRRLWNAETQALVVKEMRARRQVK